MFHSEEPELSPECLNVLADFVEDFDISLILPILPDDLNLTIISNVLRRAVRLKIHKVSNLFMYACCVVKFAYMYALLI